MAIGKTKIEEQLKRIRLLSENKAWFDTFTTATKNEILNWIKIDQLTDEGVDKFGNIIGVYSYSTQLITDGRKRAGEPYDLNDTGDFYRSMFVSVFLDSIIIDANAQKGNDNLFTKYGNAIIGLTDESFEKLKVKVLESYQKHLREVLQID
jgi:hypothetical protein